METGIITQNTDFITQIAIIAVLVAIIAMFVAMLTQNSNRANRTDDKIDSLNTKMDDKIDKLETKIDGKFEAFRQEFNDKLENNKLEISNKIDKLETKIESKFDKLDKNINEIKKDVVHLTNNINVLQTITDKIPIPLKPVKSSKSIPASSRIEVQYANFSSPLKLTELGETVAKKLNIEKMIDDNWDFIYEHINDNVSNKTAYDIQQYCFYITEYYLESILLEDDIMKLKNFAYKEGEQIQDYSLIFNVIIRDKYFKAENILIDDVDLSDPNLFNDNNQEK